MTQIPKLRLRRNRFNNSFLRNDNDQSIAIDQSQSSIIGKSYIYYLRQLLRLSADIRVRWSLFLWQCSAFCFPIKSNLPPFHSPPRPKQQQQQQTQNANQDNNNYPRQQQTTTIVQQTTATTVDNNNELFSCVDAYVHSMLRTPH